MTLYGIPNCDTVKKAMDWLRANDLAVHFHNYKKEGITKEKLDQWISKTGWEKLLNKKSATWRTLSLPQQASVTNKSSAIKIMLQYPSIIKRPVIESGTYLLTGFDIPAYEKLLKPE